MFPTSQFTVGNGPVADSDSFTTNDRNAAKLALNTAPANHFPTMEVDIKRTLVFRSISGTYLAFVRI